MEAGVGRGMGSGTGEKIERKQRRKCCMDKDILIQYEDMREEIKDIRRRIERIEKEINHLEKLIVADTVKGTRRDGTYGAIKITGIPSPALERKRKAAEKYRDMLQEKEAELLELTCQVEAYIETIPKSELRTMFRFYYIDNMPWWKVAQAMNRTFPKKRRKYTEESCKKRNQRFFENVPPCPEEIC